MVTWKHPRHWASVWSRGRAERARQRAVASRLRGAVRLRCTSAHEERTSTVSARWVLRARRSRAGIHRIGARSGLAAHQHAWSRPTPRPPAGSPRSTRCTNATPTTTAVAVVVDGRARARSRLYSAAHRVPSTTYQHGRLWLCALEQQEHLLQQRTNRRSRRKAVGLCIFYLGRRGRPVRTTARAAR